MVYLALDKTGSYPDKSVNTLVALVNLSPDSPTQQLITTLAILISLKGDSLVLEDIILNIFFFLSF